MDPASDPFRSAMTDSYTAYETESDVELPDPSFASDELSTSQLSGATQHASPSLATFIHENAGRSSGPWVRSLLSSPSPPMSDSAHPSQPNSPPTLPVVRSYWRAWAPFFAKTLGLSLTFLVVPFFQGVMLGFGEICANELAFSWGWRQARVVFPQLRPFKK
ncbi:hypothetical protein IWQ62_000205 [Dispira parvispora]|uniref:Uncharacterized protein n=1 Tax=Dispira parvispora TaxID=1520584 RepID=A0A9W8AYU3_9FUNG|nr:hypothetical protein IWQ62_000205 [Dispira parvispora]